MVKKLLVVCSVLLLILPVVVSCAGANASATTLVPASANTVVQIQVEEILSNPALKKAYDELAKTKSSWPQTADDALNQLLQKTGLDLSTVSTAVFFADIESTDKTQNTYSGLIASGSFDESALTAKIQQQTQQALTISDYKGFKVYSGTQDKFELAFIGQSRFVLGTPKAVQDTIDVDKGDQKPVSGALMDALNRVGTGLITGASVPPESIRSQIGKSVSQQPQWSVKAFHDIDVIAFAADVPALNVSVRTDAHFTNATSVQDAKDAITGIISVAKGTTQDANLKAELNNIQVTAADSWLSVRGMTSLADLATIGSGIQPPK